MNDPHEVISAFLDNEPFNAEDLSEALREPDGRALLIDLIALRCLAQSETAAVADANSRSRRFSLRNIGAVAAVLVALVAGYLTGVASRTDEIAAAPTPSRVVQSQAGWQDIDGGRLP